MKVCAHCNREVSDQAVFCEHCGCFIEPSESLQEEPKDMVTEESLSAESTAEPAAPTKRKKKWVVWLVIGIVATVLIGVIASVALSIAMLRLQDMTADLELPYEEYMETTDPSEDTQENTLSEDHAPSVPSTEASGEYTKGSVVDGWYVNPWANLCFDTRGDWVQGSTEDYGAFDADDNTECGLFLNDVYVGKQTVICFERLDGLNALITEEEYLDIVTSGVVEEVEPLLETTCKVSDYKETTIADKPFKTAQITFEGYTATQVMHVYKHDGYMIYIQVVAQNIFDATDVVNDVLCSNG